MILHRHRYLVKLIKNSPNPPDNLRIVKWMFLASRETDASLRTSFYDFLPYQHGPFSFSLYRDLDMLKSNGVLVENNRKWSVCNNISESYGELSESLSSSIKYILKKYGSKSNNELLDYTYNYYHWFTALAKRKDRRLSQIPEGTILVHTIGYEGKSVDKFFDHLLQNGIKQLIDVRKNPFSRKYGFAYKALKGISNKLEIEYHHIPQLGIPSGLRADIQTQNDRERILDWYSKTVLPAALDSVSVLIDMIKQKPSAMMCFENKPEECHRSRLASMISDSSSIPISNL